jgi:FkbM family methyltransferase
MKHPHVALHLKPTAVVRDLTAADKDLELRYDQVLVGGLAFNYAVSNRVSRKRVTTLLSKEPTTLAWIRSFGKDDVLYDVGANVGMYTVYAAVAAGCRVFAFEPEALNYAELNKNLYLNRLYDRVRAYCCAVSDRAGPDTLYLSTFAQSYSHHDFGENRWEGPVTKIAPNPASRPTQGCLGVTLDGLAGLALPRPTHVKVDVDGLEWRVLAGAKETLADPALKTVLVETDFALDRNVALLDRMADWGWMYSPDQVCTHRDGLVITPEEWARWRRDKAGGGNVIYFRDDRYFAYFREFREAYQKAFPAAS